MDHERVNLQSSGISCGVLEMSRMDKDVEAVAYAVATRLYHPARGTPAAFVIWSDIVGDYKFYEWIEKKGFGIMSKSCATENPKTGNVIAVYTWCILHEPFKRWYAARRVAKLKKVGA